MKIYAIAKNTFSEAVRQPIVYILLLLGLALLLLSFAFTLFTFSEENTAKMIKDMGIATVTLCALLISLFASSSVIADEIEKKTALTVLCKPVSRLQFLLGKYLGILAVVALAILILQHIFSVALCFLEGTAQKAMSERGLIGLLQVFLLAPVKMQHVMLEAAAFAFLQVAVLTAVSVAISTRFPLVVNVTACFLLYVGGHAHTFLTAEMKAGGTASRTCAHVVGVLFPNLESLNVAVLAARGIDIPFSCLAFGVLYALLYVTGVLALALLSLERRELM